MCPFSLERLGSKKGKTDLNQNFPGPLLTLFSSYYGMHLTGGYFDRWSFKAKGPFSDHLCLNIRGKNFFQNL